jgi:hypothetical protein
VALDSGPPSRVLRRSPGRAPTAGLVQRSATVRSNPAKFSSAASRVVPHWRPSVQGRQPSRVDTLPASLYAWLRGQSDRRSAAATHARRGVLSYTRSPVPPGSKTAFDLPGLCPTDRGGNRGRSRDRRRRRAVQVVRLARLERSRRYRLWANRGHQEMCPSPCRRNSAHEAQCGIRCRVRRIELGGGVTQRLRSVAVANVRDFVTLRASVRLRAGPVRGGVGSNPAYRPASLTGKEAAGVTLEVHKDSAARRPLGPLASACEVTSPLRPPGEFRRRSAKRSLAGKRTS